MATVCRAGGGQDIKGSIISTSSLRNTGETYGTQSAAMAVEGVQGQMLRKVVLPPAL